MRMVPIVALLSLIGSAEISMGQSCPPGFQPGGPGATGILDSFSAYVGPMADFQNKLVVGGSFSVAGPLITNGVAIYDPAADTWSPLARGLNLGSTNGFAAALATFPIGGVPRLIVGGAFAGTFDFGGAAVPETTSLAAWDGAQWFSISAGAPITIGSVWTLLDWQPTTGARRLVVGGAFQGLGGTSAYGIAQFDGQTWSNFAGTADVGLAGPFSPIAFASAIYGNQLYIGGRFTSVNGVAANMVARWSGSAWQRPGTLAAGGVTSDVSALVVFNEGPGPRLYAAGYDLRVGGQPATVASFDGVVWRIVGQNLGGKTTSLAVFNDGSGLKLYAGWTADSQQHYIYRLENNVWTPVGGGVSFPITGNFPSIFGLHVSGTQMFVGGNFQIAGSQAAYGIAQYGPCSQSICRPDFNSSGTVTTQDIFDFLGAWFANDPRADFSGGGLSVQDIFDFLTAWFVGCS